MGPLCGKCKREDPLSYMKDSRCYHCEGGEVAVVVSVIVMFFAIPLAVALVLYRFTRARALTYRIYRRLFDIGRFKVVCVPVSRAVQNVVVCSRVALAVRWFVFASASSRLTSSAMHRCGSTIRSWRP